MPVLLKLVLVGNQHEAGEGLVNQHGPWEGVSGSVLLGPAGSMGPFKVGARGRGV